MKPRHCSRCRSTIPSDAPQGMCPKCLAALGVDAPQHFVTGPDEPAVPPPTPEELQPLFPQLEILRLIGQGGMGAVYEARQKGLNRKVALKILWVRADADSDFEDRFAREGRALAQLSHENVVAIHDAGKSGPHYWLLMEYVDGPNLRQVLEEGAIESGRALPIVMQMCTALEYAHHEGVVHRDIKPENVLLTRSGRVKIADFGLAKLLARREGNPSLTRSLQAMGTPHYMAPEQIEHPKDVDHRADIYSLGVVFYEVLTGELPLGRFQMPSRKVQADPRLDEIIGKAMQKEPDRRYQSASDVGTAVDGVVSGRAPIRPRAGRHTSKQKRSWPVFVGIAASIAIVSFLVIQSGVLRAKDSARAFTAEEHFAQGQQDIRDARTMADGIVHLRAAHTLNSGLPNLLPVMEKAWRARIDGLLGANEPGQAAGLAQELATFAPSKANSDLSAKAEAAARIDLARYVRLDSPGPIVGDANALVEGQVISPTYERARVEIDGEEAPHFNSKFSKSFEGLAEGQHTKKLSIVHPDGRRLSFPLTFVVDTKKPLLTVEQPKEGEFVKGTTIVRGRVEDSTSTKVMVGNVEAQVDEQQNWVAEIKLDEGQRQIEIIATDARQQSEKAVRHVTVDIAAPTVEGIDSAARFVMGPMRPRAEIRVKDDKGLGSATLDGSPVAIGPGGVITIDGRDQSSAAARTRALVLLDKAGNKTTREISTVWDGEKPKVVFDGPGPDEVLPNSALYRLSGTLHDDTWCKLMVPNQQQMDLDLGTFESGPIAIGDWPLGETVLWFTVTDEAGNEERGSRSLKVVEPCKLCKAFDGERGMCTTCAGQGTVQGKCTPNCRDGTAVDPCPQCNSQGMARCESCRGSGKGASVQCRTCSGSASVRCTGKCSGNGTYIATCDKCGGSGWWQGFGLQSRQPCQACQKSGKATYKCVTCEGSGLMACRKCSNGAFQPQCPGCSGGWTNTPCGNCGGTHTIQSTCAACNGAGGVRRPCRDCGGGQYCKECGGTGRADKKGNPFPKRETNHAAQSPGNGSQSVSERREARAEPAAAQGVGAKRPQFLESELVSNGDCEQPSTGGGVPGWDTISGEWAPFEVSPNLRDDRSGEKFFRPVGKQAVEELSQEIDITGAWKEAKGVKLLVTARARIAGHYQRGAGDECQVVVEFVDAAGRTTGTTLTHGPAFSETWLDISLEGEVPTAAKKAKVRLIAYRHRGTMNDGYFDNVSLRISPVQNPIRGSPIPPRYSRVVRIEIKPDFLATVSIAIVGQKDVVHELRGLEDVPRQCGVKNATNEEHWQRKVLELLALDQVVPDVGGVTIEITPANTSLAPWKTRVGRTD